ncbi:MAG: methyltransferase domain-containing protein [Elusimicrobia bacterium]|nr:methyltransferase domain-containing protein [Elusimicrobiota bacterium]
MSRSWTPREVLGLTVLLSFCSLVYEMAIAACFASFTGDAGLWQSVTIGLYLAALGAGALTASRMPKADPWVLLWRVELGLTVAGAFSAAWILALETLLRVHQHFYNGSEPSTALGLSLLLAGHGGTVLIGWLSGFEVPCLIRLARETDPEGRDRTQQVLGLNYLGALAGSLGFAFALQPALDATGSVAAAAVLNLWACAALEARLAPRPGGKAALGLAAAAWAAALALSPVVARLHQTAYYAGRLGLPARAAGEACCAEPRAPFRSALAAVWEARRAVERIPSAYQRIELVTTEFKPSPFLLHFNRRPKREPGLPYGLFLHLDRRYQFSGGSEAIYHEFMAHVPVQLFGRVPGDALILGGGDGLLAKELLKYGDRLRSVTNVELDPAMAALAADDGRLRLLNGSSFRDPKVRVVVDDAFFFARNDRGRYDAVYIDFPFPYNFETARLYSVEFYRNVARLLKPGGFVVADYPLSSSADPSAPGDREALRRNSIIVNTLRAAGFQTVVPFGTESPELMPRDLVERLRGPQADPDPDPEVARLLRRAEALRFARAHPGVRADPGEDLVLLENRPWRESMLAFTLERAQPDFSFKDHRIVLDALTAERLKTLEGARFPYAEDPALVNTLLKPTLLRAALLEE